MRMQRTDGGGAPRCAILAHHEKELIMDRRTALLGLPALLSACANTRSMADGTVLAPSEGLLVVQVFGDQHGSLGFRPHGESSFGARFSESMVGAKDALAFGPRDAFLVRPLEAGEYMWTRLSLGNRFAWLENSTRFKVTRGAITYIGALRVSIDANRYAIRVADREASARQHLAANYPKALASLPFTKEMAEMRVGA